MKHKNRQLLTGILTAALALSLTACSNSPDSNASSQTLNDKGQVVLKVAASPSPHAQILQSVRRSCCSRTSICKSKSSPTISCPTTP
ncbi:MAG: hypothetical protein ACLRVT_06635 [Oscillospiraceae bacterium]